MTSPGSPGQRQAPTIGRVVHCRACAHNPAAYAARLAVSTMSISIHLPSVLRGCCAGTAELSLDAPNVRAALEEIGQRYPELHRTVCDETGAVRRHINIFVNSAHMRDRDGLDTPLVAGDVITILPAVSGG